ncbi:histidine--tRNA ligase [Mesoterricola silvestris]|uniref:Histidine--tRNA ligase n=1 Tax=Mesoterricola silvestris TaxID=2927979 RepID=A0AA48GZJ1_9BACT|nr:histidine--tRNA ligase [Mesoterricola silvestris]BDU74731.1 histidine--tRNA ligase [Mesoterricola silvestris]
MAQSVKGTRDLFGSELDWFQRIEDTVRRAFHRHGYSEIRTPILEEIEVFKRSVGESSDIVHKEMYDFLDKGKRHVAMRPENTAGVVRAAIQHQLLATSDPQLLYYIGPMFRYERMQAGRYRQFWQIGAESFQVSTPESEAESLVMLYDFLRELGLSQLTFSINSVGTPECRPAFHEAFRAFFRTREAEFCEDCHRRIEENPLRVLDCKNARCQAALEGHPVLVDFLDPASLEHHRRLKEILTALGLPFEENPRLVRGLDYYTRTAFEVLSTDLGAQSALLGGGRYDGLVKQLGGPQVAAFGWSIGLDRLVTLMQQLHGKAPRQAPPVLIPLGPAATLKALSLARTWWAAGLDVILETRGVKLKNALTTANRQGAPLALILGDGELEQGVVAVKDLAAGTQETWALDTVQERLADRRG